MKVWKRKKRTSSSFLRTSQIQWQLEWIGHSLLCSSCLNFSSPVICLFFRQDHSTCPNTWRMNKEKDTIAYLQILMTLSIYIELLMLTQSPEKTKNRKKSNSAGQDHINQPTSGTWFHQTHKSVNLILFILDCVKPNTVLIRGPIRAWEQACWYIEPANRPCLCSQCQRSIHRSDATNKPSRNALKPCLS